MRLTSAKWAMTPVSMSSLFSKVPIASANRRTLRGLRMAQGTPASHSRLKGSFSYPPVASMATNSTSWLLQKAARAWMPSGARSKLREGPSCPIRASKVFDETSTPQMILATVTFLVRAIGDQATVRSCVTAAAVPMLIHGCSRRGNGRRQPRDGPGGRRVHRSVAPNPASLRLLIQGESSGARWL
jgi:hypothetical protein